MGYSNHLRGEGATGSENQTTAMRVGLCGSNDKSEHYHRPLGNRIKAESVWQFGFSGWCLGTGSLFSLLDV